MSKDESQEHDAARQDEAAEAEPAPQTDEERRELHRKLIKGAAALAAAAIGGGLIAESADAQVRRPGQTLRTAPVAGRADVSSALRGRQLVQNLNSLPAPPARVTDPAQSIKEMQQWLTPIIDRAGGAVSSIGVNVASSITING